MLSERLDGMPQRLPAPFGDVSCTTMQFSVGSQGTGAPWHWHRDAFNLLLKGKKHWRLRPPSLAAVACGEASIEEEEAAFGDASCLEVVQEAGDMVYVPRHWGHDVTNEGELTVCVALEFTHAFL